MPECVHAEHCNAVHNQQLEDQKTGFSSRLVKSLSGNCGQDEFQCLFSDECIKIGQVCDGRPDCKDYSDEDPRKQQSHSYVHYEAA